MKVFSLNFAQFWGKFACLRKPFIKFYQNKGQATNDLDSMYTHHNESDGNHLESFAGNSKGNLKYNVTCH